MFATQISVLEQSHSDVFVILLELLKLHHHTDLLSQPRWYKLGVACPQWRSRCSAASPLSLCCERLYRPTTCGHTLLRVLEVNTSDKIDDSKPSGSGLDTPIDPTSYCFSDVSSRSSRNCTTLMLSYLQNSGSLPPLPPLHLCLDAMPESE